MRFVKIKQVADKFDYMMLSRLIQDAKYFIEYPELKHLWTRDLNTHIQKMLDIYNSLDPKPEWTSEEEINNLGNQMKESYKNHWNEIHPDNKIEAAEQPTNYYKFRHDLPEQQVADIKVGQEVWFEPWQIEDNISNANIVKEIKDNGGHIEDHGIVKEIMSWPYDNYPYYKVEVNDGIVVEVATVYDSKEKRDLAANRSFSEKFIPVDNDEFHKNSAEQPTTPKPTATLPDNMVWAWDPKGNQWIAVMKDNPVVTPPTYNPNNLQNTSTTTTQMYTPIKSTLIDSLNQFLDGDKYSREIKIEKGLISDGLIKFTGINPIKGPKYSITDKGLNLLKQAAQEEYDFEKDYIKARKSYLLDGISEEEFKTGTPESQGQMHKFSIFEKDGSELAQIEASNETDAKVKFFMENPEYEGSQTINVKKIDSTYSETTTRGLDFPNQPISPSTDIKVDTHGWVNQANLKKEADMIDDLTFEADMSDIEIEMGYGFSYDNKEIFAKLKEKYPQLANALEPEIYETTGYGTIKWGLDIEARNWGLHTLKLRAFPAKVTLRFDIHYFENEQDKENSDDTSSYFELDFDLTDIDIESEFNLNSNDDLFVHKIEINGFDSATLYA